MRYEYYSYKLIFDKNGFATCPESNEQYKLENGRVIQVI